MSDAIQNVDPVNNSESPENNGTEQANNTATVNRTQNSQENANFNSISDMNDLREKSPKLYEAILQGIAQHINDELRKHADRLKKIMRENSPSPY